MLEAAVIVRRETTGEDWLHAYFHPNPDQQRDPIGIEDQLSQHLPPYMIPDRFELLDRFPLTPAGKIDRRALAERTVNTTTPQREYRAPRTATETALQTIWQAILQREPIGTDEDFFRIGGQSLKAIRLQGRIQQQWEVKLSFRDFFLYPTIATFAQHLDTLLVAAPNETKRPLQAIPPAADYVLSPAQRGLWVMEQFRATGAAYNVGGPLRLRGAVDRSTLEKALLTLIDRHEILRTNFIAPDGQPRQQIHAIADFAFRLEWVDLQADAQAEATCHAQLLEALAQPFDLARDPLIRAQVWQVAEAEYVLQIILHHITMDDWSIPVLLRDLTTAYNALQTGNSPLQPLRLQYKDYAHWMQAQLDEGSMEEQGTYWRQKLGGHLPVLDLPFDRPRPAQQTFAGSRAGILLSPAEIAPLLERGQATGATTYITLLASVKVLLFAITRQEDLIVGTPFAGRTELELADQIGFYVRTLLIRNRVAADDNFAQLLDTVKQSTLEAFHHSDFPLDALMEQLDLKRDPSRSPLFDVWVQLKAREDDPRQQLQLRGVTTEGYELSNPVSKFDLGFFFTEQAEGIELALEYNTDLFDAATIQNLLHYYQNILRSLRETPTQPIGEVALLDPAATQAVVARASAAPRDYPTEQTIAALFDQSASAHADRVALACGERQYRYAELRTLTNQLARCLRDQHGVQAGDVVGIHLDRSEWYVIAMLSILKAGAAFLPIDRQLPAERIHYMLDTAAAKLVLCYDGDVDKALPVAQFDVQRQRAEWANLATDDLPQWGDSEALAYVLFTSGSTGLPKGAMVEQKGILNHFYTKIESLALDENTTIALTASISFDVAIWQALTALLVGGTTRVYPREVVLQPRQ